MFKDELRNKTKRKNEIWRRPKPNAPSEKEYFSLYEGEYKTEKQGYTIHWIFSSEKKKRDRYSREERLSKAEKELSVLNSKINSYNLKEKSDIEEAVTVILKNRKVVNFIRFEVKEKKIVEKQHEKPGRPPKGAPPTKKIVTIIYTLTWYRDKPALDKEKNVDGVFPLLSTDPSLTALEALKAYKYQPYLEERFCQLKSFLELLPLCLKKVERIEALAFIFFMAQLVQSLLEREIRNEMKENNIESLDVYPEDRASKYPTTRSIMDSFNDIMLYEGTSQDMAVEIHGDPLKEVHKQILGFLNMTEEEYWGRKMG